MWMEEGLFERTFFTEKSWYRYDYRKASGKENWSSTYARETLDKEVQAYIQETRKVGGVVNARIAIACSTGILRRRNSNLLAVNGGHVMLTKALLG